MNCTEHKGCRIEYICTDNECTNKFLCNQCFQSSTKHTLVKYMDFYQFLMDLCHNSSTQYTMEQISQYIHGTSLEKKLKFFNKKKSVPEDEFYEVHMKKLSSFFDEFSNQLQIIVNQAKKDMISRYQNQIAESFDKQALNLQQYQRRGCQLVLNQITKNDTQQANESLQKLHTGSYEVSFAKKTLYDSYYAIREQLEKTINSCQSYVQRLVKQITILSEKSIFEKQSQVIQSLASSFANKSNKQIKRQNIQVKLINNESTKLLNSSPRSNTQALNNTSKGTNFTTTIQQIAGSQSSYSNKKQSLNNTSNLSKIRDVGNFYFSPQNNSKQFNKKISIFV